MKLITVGVFPIFIAALALSACGKDGKTGTASAPDAVTTPQGTPHAESKAIHPLSDTSSWTYHVKPLGGSAVCGSGTRSTKVVGRTKAGARDAFRVKSFCTAAGESLLSLDGENVDVFYGGAWIRAISTPVKEGHSWNMTSAIRYVWKKMPDQKTAAGTFSDCWKAEQQVSYQAYRIACRGVGIIREYSRDLAGGGWDAELAAYTP